MNSPTSESLKAWENEGGKLLYAPEHEEQGIIRTFVEVFAVGPFRYSNLVDAVAQSRRVRLGQ